VALERACVARRQLPNGASAAAIAEYVSYIEYPPATKDDGFDLLMNDNRKAPAEAGMTPVTDVYQLVYTYLNNIQNTANPLSRTSILDMAAVPQAYVGGDLTDYNNYKAWGGGWTSANKEFISQVVSMYYDCSPMPMLIGSTELEEINERVDMFGGGWTTGGDEGLAWAIRALSPNWADIWDKGSDFPAPFHGETEKVIFFLTDAYSNKGYPNGPMGAAGTDALSSILQLAADSGIDIHLFLDGSMWPSTLNKFYTIFTANIPEENLHYFGSSNTTAALQAMEQATARQFRVRIM
jgi:hypothetical protein